MSKPIIAILSAGEMGAAVAGGLHNAGYQVTTITANRGAETVTRAKQAGMQIRPDIQSLLSDCQIFMSILPPAQSASLAQQVATEAKNNGRSFTFVECNAISPDHSQQNAALFADTKVKFVDGGIIGGPPQYTKKAGYIPKLYISGPDCQLLNQTDGFAYHIRQLGAQIGHASGMKMSYAAITKGVTSLLSAAFMTADRLELLDPLMAELQSSQTELFRMATNNIQRTPADAARWAPEMAEIAQTFKSAGVPDGFHIGAEQMMQIMDNSPFGIETRRTRDLTRTAAQTIKKLKPLGK